MTTEMEIHYSMKLTDYNFDTCIHVATNYCVLMATCHTKVPEQSHCHEESLHVNGNLAMKQEYLHVLQ